MKGTTISKSELIHNDVCILKNSDDSGYYVKNCSGSKCDVEENYCGSSSFFGDDAFIKYYNCPNGCKDGACIAETGKQITKQDVINWIDQNCYDQTISVSEVQNKVSASQSGTKSAAITGNAIKDKIFSITKEYWRD